MELGIKKEAGWDSCVSNIINQYNGNDLYIGNGAISCIYLIINPKNKYYIGQTVNFKKRHNTYKNVYRTIRTQGKIYESLKKYGYKNHSFSILKICKREELDKWEIFYINLFNSTDKECGLNLKSGGKNGIPNEEYKSRISQSLKDNSKLIEDSKKRLELLRLKIKNGEIPHPMKGKTHSKETIEKILKTKSERVYEKKKKVISEETKEKLRQINLGKKLSEETKKKIRDAAILFKESGKIRKKSSFIVTDEYRKKMSEKTKGSNNPNYGKGMKPHVKAILLSINKERKFTDEQKKKMSLRRKGVPKSEEFKIKNSISNKGKKRPKIKLLDTKTNIEYSNLKSAAKVYGFNAITLTKKIKGIAENDTSFIRIN